MQKLIAGQLQLPQNKRQKLLHKNAGEFLISLQRRKDTAEVLADRLTSTPAGMLPMVF
ncbi:hypothetical protein AAEO56_06410 [Flavobacterium sp. DGU11]|uniref:Uncharacterized protein n=1 Tax=Flavobacterium arundinis TaxID=3139143 RepID=A0ABU9HUR3_9FLAO